MFTESFLTKHEYDRLCIIHAIRGTLIATYSHKEHDIYCVTYSLNGPIGG